MMWPPKVGHVTRLGIFHLMFIFTVLRQVTHQQAVLKENEEVFCTGIQNAQSAKLLYSCHIICFLRFSC